jgi:hypothetical protein
MRQFLFAAAVGLSAWAFGDAWAAEEWGLPNEEVARFEAKVVDILCELTGDCPADCGGGARQLGLVTMTGELVLPAKNAVIFDGTAGELIEFCGQQVIVDGLFTTNRGYKIFALQFLRPAPDGQWRRANRWLGQWAREIGVAADSDEAGAWYANDTAIRRIIAEEGKLGLGPE